jgi:hypothetical protein
MDFICNYFIIAKCNEECIITQWILGPISRENIIHDNIDMFHEQNKI